ncbi:MAG TPA: cupin domain-containing protein [Pyrinomonadaceae bacterium]|jgi:quercetin dioxygenase-like cupin family protein|nr:cupin domain-containing protein [Pyrinomonadaceae bacterium]
MIGEAAQLEALVTDWNSVPAERISDGIDRQLVVGQAIMLCRLRFDPFVVTPAHRHPHEQATLVMQGKVKFVIGDDERIVIASPGDVLHFPSNNWHGATMLDEEVVLIDIFSPIREDFLA